MANDTETKIARAFSAGKGDGYNFMQELERQFGDGMEQLFYDVLYHRVNLRKLAEMGNAAHRTNPDNELFIDVQSVQETLLRNLAIYLSNKEK